MKKVLEAALLTLCLSLPLQAQPLPGDPLQATIHRLSNGLTVYLSPNHQVPRISAWIAVRTGSKNDPSNNTGLAHYLEHMLFKGTQSLGTLDYQKEKPHLDRIAKLYDLHFQAKDPAERSRLYEEIDRENLQAVKYEIPNEIARIYEQLGFHNLNAFTGDEMTVYVNDMPSNRLDVWAALEAERFAHPVFRLFQSELEAVYEEKNQTMDNAEWLLGEAVNKKLYKAHPYGQQTTIGEIEHLKNPSLTHLHEHYKRWYVPNNMAIALSGDFETASALKLLEQRFGAWKPKPLPPAKAWPLPAPNGSERVEIKYEAEEKVVIAWPTVPVRHPDADAVAVMDMLMDNAVAGLINLELNQAQKVKAAGSYPIFHNDAGDWQAWALPKRGQSLEEAEGLLLETVDHLKDGRFTDEDIKAVVTSFEVNEKARLESNEARVSLMAESFWHLEPWPEAVARLARLRLVTKQDVLRVAHKYIGPNRVIAYRRKGPPELPRIAKPQFTKVDIDQSRASAMASKILAMPASAIEPRWLVEGRDYLTAESPAGKLYAARNPFNDLFSLTWVFNRGRRQERRLCTALSLLELAGAGDLTAEQLKKKLFGLGTTLSYGCGERESSVTLSGLDGHLWESLELMRLRFERPRLDEGTLKRMVDVAIGAHQDAKRDPEAVYHALGEWSRRGKESAVLAELKDAELEALTLAPLVKLISGVPGFTRRVGYVGNRPLGELNRLLDEKRSYQKPPARPTLALLRPQSPRVVFAHRDMVQAQVGLFAADDAYDPTRSVDYSFLSHYLGGSMGSLLFQEIRESRSLAYAVWGQYHVTPYKGDDSELMGGLNCQADKTIEASSLLRGLTLAPPLSPEQFSQTAKAIEQNFRTNPIQFRAIPSALIAWEDLGLPPGDPRPARFQRALRYTLADMQAFTHRFKGRPSTLYVLGRRDRVGLEELKKLGDFEERKIDELFPY